jgi:hypothetical protein
LTELAGFCKQPLARAQAPGVRPRAASAVADLQGRESGQVPAPDCAKSCECPLAGGSPAGPGRARAWFRGTSNGAPTRAGAIKLETNPGTLLQLWLCCFACGVLPGTVTATLPRPPAHQRHHPSQHQHTSHPSPVLRVVRRRSDRRTGAVQRANRQGVHHMQRASTKSNVEKTARDVTLHRSAGTRRTAATSVPRLGVEWPSSHLSERLPNAGGSYLTTSRNPSVTICTTSPVHHSHRRRRISLPRRHRHRPPIRLGRASDGAYRAVPPSRPSASSSCRHMLQFAEIERSALGRIHKRDTSGEHRVSCFCSPPVNVSSFLPRRI